MIFAYVNRLLRTRRQLLTHPIGVPIFNYLLSLAGSVGFASITVTLPAYCWIYDHKAYRVGTLVQRVKFWFHCFLIALGCFLTVGGTVSHTTFIQAQLLLLWEYLADTLQYGVVQAVVNAYADGDVGKAFDCADNSGTIV